MWVFFIYWNIYLAYDTGSASVQLWDDVTLYIYAMQEIIKGCAMLKT